MVRAGAVQHPGQWRWNSYAELVGERERYRIVAIAQLLQLLGGWEETTIRKRYQAEIEYAIEAGSLRREPDWSESIAVGSEEFIRRMSQRLDSRQRLEVANAEFAGGLSVWTVKEAPVAYSADLMTKTASKGSPASTNYL